MTGLKRQLQDAQKVLEELLVSIHELTEQFGFANVSLNLGDESAAQELKERLLGNTTIVQELKDKQEKIRSLLSEQEEKSGAMKELKAGKKEFLERLELLYEELGKKAFEVYRGGFSDQERYEAFFSKLDELAQRQEEREKGLSTLEEERERSSFLKKISFSAKASMAKTTLSGIEKEMKKHYATVGRELLEQENGVILEEKALLPLLATCRETFRKLEQLEEEESALQSEIVALTNALSGLGVEKSGSKRLRELEKEQETEESRLSEAAYEYGAALLLMPHIRSEVSGSTESGADTGESGADTGELLAKIEAFEKQEEEQRSTIAALEAAIAARDKEQELEKQRKDLDSMTEKKKSLEQEIRDLKKLIKDGEGELVDLTSRAGSVLSSDSTEKAEDLGEDDTPGKAQDKTST
jgi:uncharacterized coiled-coil protein SlyX